MRPDIKSLIKQGRDKEKAARELAEQSKLGILRGGSSGCLDGNNVYGVCHRIAHLRSKGINSPIDYPTYEMFDAGFANEDIIVRLLKESWDGIIKCEEEIPVKWTTNSGALVTGRPDAVLLNKEDKPVLGLEFKQVVSIWTVYKVLLKEIPKNENLIQAAHYSMIHNVPFDLIYTSRGYFHVTGTIFDAEQIPYWFLDKCSPDNPYIEYKDEKPYRIIPFHKIFKLEWVNDRLYYTTDNREDPVETVITKDGIKRYYDAVAQMESHQDLGPMMIGKHVSGDKYDSPCKYCDLKDLCKSNPSYVNFIQEAKKLWQNK